ncbi:MAG: V-type ATP synthase subunit D [Armatimonadetes bacterium]|nr:V-type ATP synthase subunit D [Armatimonadota bacterium]
MMRMGVNPTRMELLRLRKRLTVARRGHKLLKDKLDGLVKEFLSIAKEYKRFRREVDEELPYALKLFVLAEITSARPIIENALENTKQELKLEVRMRRVMSVPVPELEATFGKASGGYSLVHTPPELDQAIVGLRSFLPKLLKMAQLEEAVRRLADEIEKTRRRVNALEHTMIPRMVETVRFIAGKLDEIERSNTSRLMKIKAQRMAQEGV